MSGYDVDGGVAVERPGRDVDRNAVYATPPVDCPPLCEHRCLLDDGHVDRGQTHFYGYLMGPSGDRDADWVKLRADLAEAQLDAGEWRVRAERAEAELRHLHGIEVQESERRRFEAQRIAGRYDRPMESTVIHNNKSDDEGRPAGGCTHGRGFTIAWQDGPLGSGDDRREPNGAFVEDVITAAIGRLEFYQLSEFECDANKFALQHLELARQFLRDRTDRGVEGTHGQ